MEDDRDVEPPPCELLHSECTIDRELTSWYDHLAEIATTGMGTNLPIGRVQRIIDVSAPR